METNSLLMGSDRITRRSGKRGAISPFTFALLLIISLLFPGVYAEVPAAYYAGETYTFTTDLDPDLFIFDWEASCCSDPACCDDPSCCGTKSCGSHEGASGHQFVWTAPDVNCPTNVTVSVLAGVKAYPACNGLALINLTIQPQTCSITVIKETEPLGDPEAFNLRLSYGPTEFTLAGGEAETFGGLPPGSYVIGEEEALGWDLSSIGVEGAASARYSSDATSWHDDFSSGDGFIKVTIAPGETARVNFTNIKLGSIVVGKVTEPKGSGEVFEFAASYADQKILLKDGETNASGLLVPGTYTIEEIIPEGWTLADINGAASIEGSKATVNLGPGETARVNFTNIKLGSIVIGKVTEPKGSDEVFEFAASYADQKILLKDGETNASGHLVPGTYTIEEIIPEGWTLADINGAASIEGSKATVNLGPGETARVNFINKRGGSVEVTKVVNWSSYPFDHRALVDTGFEICIENESWKSCKTVGSDGGVLAWNDLAPGVYNVSEKENGLVWTVTVEGSPFIIDGLTDAVKQVMITNEYTDPEQLNPGLEVTKTASPTAGVPHTEVTFTIVVRNTGKVPLALEVNDTLPAGMSYISASPAPDRVIENADGTTEIFWDGLGTLGPGNETTILVVAEIGEDIPKSAPSAEGLTVLGSSDLGTGADLAGEEVLWVQQVGRGGLADTIEGLIWLRVRLEVEMAKMIELSRRFDPGSAGVVFDEREGDLPGVLVKNYTRPATDERLVLFVDAAGNITRSEYYNPEMDSVLTSEYGPDGALVAESLLSVSMLERLRIDYDTPAPGYRTRTVTDYKTGDTLIERVDPTGEVIQRDYRRTPGIPKEKQFRLRNAVTAAGRSDRGDVTDSDYADVTVAYLSELRLTKVASPIPAAVGTVISYSYAVENVGGTTIANITLFDDRLDRLIDLNRTTLKPGEFAGGTADYTIVTADLPGPIENKATVTGTDPQGDEIADEDTATVPLYAFAADIDLIKTPDRTNVTVGEVVTYSFVVQNVGIAPVEGLLLYDDRLDRFIELNRTALKPGEIAVGTADYTILPEDIPRVVNNATVTGVAVSEMDDSEQPVSAEDSAVVNVTGADNKTKPPSDLTVTKTALQKAVRPGDEVTYNITVCGPAGTRVNVRDLFDRPVEFVCAEPRPLKIGDRWQEWNLTLPGGNNTTCATIILHIKTLRKEFTFEMEQGVSGEGFVKVANDYNTAPPSYTLTNVVTATDLNKTNNTDTDTETVLVSEAGTELSTREHGSGRYDSDEVLRMRTENKSISMEKEVSTAYAPTTLGLYNGRVLDYSSRWSQEARAKNRVTGASMTESYRYATSIDRESRIFLDRNESVMEIDAEFDGVAQFGFFKMLSNSSGPRSKPTFEMEESYAGSFKVLQRVDEYGRGVSYEKSASGSGLVVGDRRVGSSQRSYEAGAGSYESEEIIETGTNYIAKDINVTSAPASLNLTNSTNINAAMRWKEGIYSRAEGVSYIGEEYYSIDRLEREATFRGLNDLSSEADFSGAARYRVVVANRSKGAGSEGEGDLPLIDYDEVYSGDYSVARKIVLSGVPKYDHPHLSISKIGEADKNSSQVRYAITVTNDGNAPLEDITVEDVFPPRTSYISSSLRPEIAADRAVWSVSPLGAGGRFEIELVLEVIEDGGSLVNVVKATASARNDTHLTASNFSVLEAGWLSCCPAEIFASKTGSVDPVLENIITYRLTVQNLQNETVVANIVDTLPSGLSLLGASVMPAEYDRSRGRISWVIADLNPREVRTIEYLVEARTRGRFLNVAEVEAYTLGGTELGIVSISAVVDVGDFEEAEEVPAGWVPPDWELKYSPMTYDMTCEGPG